MSATIEREIRVSDEPTRQILRAAAEGDVAFLSSARDVGRAVCSSGCSALHWAAGNDRIDAVRFLVETARMSVDVRATRKSRGRTPLHYACRNGATHAAKLLVELGADVNALAKHGVSPFQLSVWQNHLPICRWLVEERGVDPAQVNDFDCGAVHWIGICPTTRANFSADDEKIAADGGPREEDWDGADLIPLCRWLASWKGVDFRARQRQGHTSLHKAAWGGHVMLLRHLRDVHGLLDDVPDDAGNYAADLADMANTARHDEAARFLREECSGARAESCRVLGIPVSADRDEIRRAYLAKARSVHPDRLVIQRLCCNGNDEEKNDAALDVSDGRAAETDCNFDAVRRAYEHLTLENGVGKQSNPAHSIHLMLELHSTVNASEDTNPLTNQAYLDEHDQNLFKARLVAVLLEYGDKGLELCNIQKKWRQVWTDTPFPFIRKDGQRKKGALAEYIRRNAGDVVDMIKPESDTGSIVVVPKQLTRAHVSQVASTPDIS